MLRESAVVVGRENDLATVEEFAGRAALVLVRGVAGIGKTSLLGALHRRWRPRSMNVIRVRCSTVLGQWDEFGALTYLDAFRSSFHEIGDSRVAAAMAAVSRLCVPETYRSSQTRSVLFAELVRLFRSLRSNGRTAVVLVDDVHTASDPGLAVAAAHRAGCTVVACAREDGLGTEPTALGRTADLVLDLAPLPDAKIDELLAAVARMPLDEVVTASLRVALGSLAGNPGTVLASFEQLVAEGRLTELDGYLFLNDPARAMALPPEHVLVQHVAQYGGMGLELVAVVAGTVLFGMDDLPVFAAATGRALDSCGRAVDSLVIAGVFDCDDDGVLRTLSPALVDAVVDKLGRAEVSALHRALAEHLLRGEHCSGSAALADHLALAGPAQPPDPSFAAPLEVEAARVLRWDPVLSARWYRAALRHCPPGRPGRGRMLTTVLRLLVGNARFQDVAEVVAEMVTTGIEDLPRYELAASAALAAVHLGRPVPVSVTDALADAPACRAPLEFAARWFAGEEPQEAGELIAAFTAFRADPADFSEPAVQSAIAAAAELNDVVALLELVLGAGYGGAGVGPLANYTRIVRSYHRGEWAGILSQARQLELTDQPRTVIRQLARLFAAEVLSATGESAAAASWLARADEDGPCLAMRSWVDMGITYRSGDWGPARKAGWAAYETIAARAEEGNHLGLRVFLVRLAFIEGQKVGGRVERLRFVCAEAKRWHARFGGTGLLVAKLILMGLAERDYASAMRAAELLREQHNLSELMRACVTLAFLADDPRPWYYEAYELAKRLGGPWMKDNVLESMRECGVERPRQRAYREHLSEVEEQIIVHVQQGLTNRQIAAAIKVTEKTVEKQLTRLFARTGCRSRLDLATASLEGRLIVTGADGADPS